MKTSLNKIKVSNCIGVSKAALLTERLAYHAKKLSGKTALDMGTGTGFVAYISNWKGGNLLR